MRNHLCRVAEIVWPCLGRKVCPVTVSVGCGVSIASPLNRTPMSEVTHQKLVIVHGEYRPVPPPDCSKPYVACLISGWNCGHHLYNKSRTTPN